MKPPRLPPELGLLAGMGISVAVWLTAGVLAGRWADNAWGVAPWGTLSGALVGITGAGVNIYQIVRRLDARETHPAPPDPTKSRDPGSPDEPGAS